MPTLIPYRQCDPEAVTMDKTDPTRGAARARSELEAMEAIADSTGAAPGCRSTQPRPHSGRTPSFIRLSPLFFRRRPRRRFTSCGQSRSEIRTSPLKKILT